ncbi:MAG: PrsW family intramembrane metalloprotease [Actinomycetales bacterium]|nr:MAG: PrsW family intramembrane metalloprotease [Actinomycetales bacterium]
MVHRGSVRPNPAYAGAEFDVVCWATLTGMLSGSIPPHPSPRPAANPTARPGLRRVLGYGALVTVFLVCWVLLAVFNGMAFGVQLASLTALLAALPLLVVVPVYLWLDRLEAEPARYLVFAFLWGALCAPVGALLLNTTAEVMLMKSGFAQADSLTAILAAPPVEEGLKGLAVLAIAVIRRREFDGVIDGIVYAGLAGAGFAFSENIVYLAQAFQEQGAESLTIVFVLRCVMGPFAHPLFTAFIGIGLGLGVAVARTTTGRVGFGTLGYLCAILLHGIWNASATVGVYFETYFFFQVPIFIGFVVLIAVLRHRESATIRRFLSRYADAGWFSHQEVAMLASASGRRAARRWAKARGAAAGQAMRSFQDAASALALLRSRMHRGVAETAAIEHERVLLDAITSSRRVFTGGSVLTGAR